MNTSHADEDIQFLEEGWIRFVEKLCAGHIF